MVGVASGARAPRAVCDLAAGHAAAAGDARAAAWRKAAAFALLDRRNLTRRGAAARDLRTGSRRAARARPRRADCGRAERRRSAGRGQRVRRLSRAPRHSRRTRSSCCFSAACIASSGSICSPRRSPLRARRIRRAHLVLAGPDEHGLMPGLLRAAARRTPRTSTRSARSTAPTNGRCSKTPT